MANSKVVLGSETLIDLSDDSAVAGDVAQGYTFLTKDGTLATGTLTIPSASVVDTSVVMNGYNSTYTIPDWATCTDAQLEEAKELSRKGYIDNLYAIFSNQTGITWANGTEKQIVRALDLYYNNLLDIFKFFAVGQVRSVSLSAMSAYGSLRDTHVAQSVNLVLSQKGGKNFSNPVNGKTECAFQVDQVNVLSDAGDIGTTNSWENGDRRGWCNNVYRNAFSSTLKPIFKQFVNQTGIGGGSSSGTVNTNDYFALRAEIELRGTNTLSVDGEGSLVNFYSDASNVIKSTLGGVAQLYETRSPVKGQGNNRKVIVKADGSYVDSGGWVVYGAPYLAPFGVI